MLCICCLKTPNDSQKPVRIARETWWFFWDCCIPNTMVILRQIWGRVKGSSDCWPVCITTRPPCFQLVISVLVSGGPWATLENGGDEQLRTFVCNDYGSWHQKCGAWILLTLQSNSKLIWVLHASWEKLTDEAFSKPQYTNCKSFKTQIPKHVQNEPWLAHWTWWQSS
jgi:hypothetical protein